MTAAGLSGVSAASFVTAEFTGYGAGEQQKVGYSNSLAWNDAGAFSYYNLWVAEHTWSVGEASETTWCVQMFQGVDEGVTYSFEVVAAELVPQSPPSPGPMGVTKADLVRDAMARWLDAGNHVISGAWSANAAAAAFATLVWEITHENLATTDLAEAKSRLSLDTGAFRAQLTGEAASVYGAMVDSLGIGGWLTVDAEGWRSATAQDQIRMVPAPGALVLLAGAFGAARRRRR